MGYKRGFMKQLDHLLSIALIISCEGFELWFSLEDSNIQFVAAV